MLSFPSPIPSHPRFQEKGDDKCDRAVMLWSPQQSESPALHHLWRIHKHTRRLIQRCSQTPKLNMPQGHRGLGGLGRVCVGVFSGILVFELRIVRVADIDKSLGRKGEARKGSSHF
ncbi:hypothetical protein ILYODFUR_002271 [Ilyodon furcidens]|uniref:Uncharacterized protein n=1 Tax=Ilyodon furcidens TaxID=33524 RepID=A0ABV0SW72_9TELE